MNSNCKQFEETSNSDIFQPKTVGHLLRDAPLFLAEKQRFELWNPVTGYTISNRAPSTN